jgi:hypothetical protein
MNFLHTLRKSKEDETPRISKVVVVVGLRKDAALLKMYVAEIERHENSPRKF